MEGTSNLADICNKFKQQKHTMRNIWDPFAKFPRRTKERVMNEVSRRRLVFDKNGNNVCQRFRHLVKVIIFRHPCQFIYSTYIFIFLCLAILPKILDFNKHEKIIIICVYIYFMHLLVELYLLQLFLKKFVEVLFVINSVLVCEMLLYPMLENDSRFAGI